MGLTNTVIYFKLKNNAYNKPHIFSYKCEDKSELFLNKAMIMKFILLFLAIIFVWLIRYTS